MKQEGKRSLWQRYSDYCFRQALWVGWGFILLAFAIFLTIPVGAAISNQLFLGEIERNVQRLEKVEGAILIDKDREFCGDWASQGSCDFVVDELWWTDKPFSEVRKAIPTHSINVSLFGFNPVAIPVLLKNAKDYSRAEFALGDLPYTVIRNEDLMKEWQETRGGAFYTIRVVQYGPRQRTWDFRTWL